MKKKLVANDENWLWISEKMFSDLCETVTFYEIFILYKFQVHAYMKLSF